MVKRFERVSGYPDLGHFLDYKTGSYTQDAEWRKVAIKTGRHSTEYSMMSALAAYIQCFDFMKSGNSVSASGIENARKVLVRAIKGWENKNLDSYRNLGLAKKDDLAWRLHTALKPLQGVSEDGNEVGGMAVDIEHQRLGVVYLFSHMEAPEIEFSEIILDVAFSAVNIALTAGSKAMDIKKDGVSNERAGAKELKEHFEKLAKNVELGAMGGELLESPVAPVISESISGVEEKKGVWSKIMAWIRSLVRSTIEKVYSSLGTAMVSIEKIIVTAGSWIIKLVNTEAAKHASAFAMSFVNAAGAIVGAVAKGVEYLHRYIEENSLVGKGVEVRMGHPSAMVSALDRFMKIDIGNDVVKGMVSAGKGVAGVFGSPIASMVISIVNTALRCIVNAFLKVWQAQQLRKFINKAKVYWGEKSVHKKPSEFNAWFKKYALRVPFISACTINFAGCGNPIFFFRMLQDDGDGKPFCSPGAYKAASSYLYRTNKSLVKYAKDSGFDVKSDDPIVQIVLKIVKSGVVYKPVTIIGNDKGFVLRAVSIFKKVGEGLG